MRIAPSFVCRSPVDKYYQRSIKSILWQRCRLCRVRLAALVLVLSAVPLVAPITGQSVDESQVKAAYLYNFTKFVEWPATAFAGPDDPFVICVVGDDHTGDVLERSLQQKRAYGRSLRVRRPHSPDEFKSCHILFVGFSERERTAKVLRALRGESVLSVGQSEEFLPLGGMINLARHDRTIELEINPEVPNAAGLKVSSRLLVVARVVKIKAMTEVDR